MNTFLPRVFVIDDDDAFRERLVRAFIDRGYETHGAAGLGSTKTLMELFTPDWAVIDLRMPDGSGLDVLQLLVNRFPNIRALVLTGYGSISTALEAIKLGAVHYLSKPAGMDEIVMSLLNPPGDGRQSSSEATPSLQQVEWDYINRVVTDCKGNISQASKMLGLHRRSLQRKLAKHPGKLV